MGILNADCCLDIDFRFCDENNCESFYLDDVEGMNGLFAERLTTASRVAMDDVLLAAKKTARERLKGDAKSFLKTRGFNIACRANHTCERSAYKTITGTGNTYNGYVIDVDLGEYQSIKISDIKILSTAIVQTPVKIFDLDTGLELWSSEFFNGTYLDRVKANIEITSSRIFIAYDSTNTSVYDCGGECGCEPIPNCNCRGEIYPATIDITADKILANVNFVGTSFGLDVEYSICCSVNRVLCENASDFKKTFAYYVAYSLASQGNFSERYNFAARDNTDYMAWLSKEMTTFLKREIDALYFDEKCVNCVDSNVITRTLYIP